jgi:hypothetical protein
MNKDLASDLQKNLEEIIKDLDTITKIHVRLDELSLQLSDVVQLASVPAEEIHREQSSTKLLELVSVLLNRVELGLNDLEKRVISIEYIKNRIKA